MPATTSSKRTDFAPFQRCFRHALEGDPVEQPHGVQRPRGGIMGQLLEEAADAAFDLAEVRVIAAIGAGKPAGRGESRPAAGECQ